MTTVSGCTHCGSVLDLHARFCPECGKPLTQQESATLPGNAPNSPKTDPLLGRTVIGQFVIRQRIGEGGMGAVYLAEQPSMDRTVVIKVLHPVLGEQPEVARRFQTEAQAAARLRDAHIVQVFNYGAMEDGTLFLAMEHLPGETLAQVIRREGQIDESRALAIAIQIAMALREAHHHRVVHRDLKPSNVILVQGADAEHVKVLDFGVARIQGGSGTQTDAPVGTPRYMSPEQLDGRAVDGRSDLYALGLVLYEMLVGHPPFQADTPVGYIHQHVSLPPPPPREVAPEAGISPDLEALILQCLEKNPENRPASADAFLKRARELHDPLRSPAARAGAPASESGGPPLRLLLAAVLLTVGAVGLGAMAYLGLRAAHLGEAQTTPAAPPPPEVGPDLLPDEPPDPPELPPISAADLGTPAVAPLLPTPGANLPPLSPAARHLLKKSLPELERELRRVVDRAFLPPSSKTQLYDAYGMYVTGLPDDAQSRKSRKIYLIQVILGYASVPTLPVGFDRPLPELEQVLRELDSPVPPADRVQSSKDTAAALLKNARSPEDREYWRRYAVVTLIQGLTGDEDHLEKAIRRKLRP